MTRVLLVISHKLHLLCGHALHPRQTTRGHFVPNVLDSTQESADPAEGKTSVEESLWIARGDFVVLPNYNEDEPMFRDTLRTSALVFNAECDRFLLRHAGAFRVRLGWLRGFGRQHQASCGSLRLSRTEYLSC